MSSKKRPRYSLEPDLDVVVEDATFPVHSLHLMTASPGFSTTSCCNHLQPVVVGSGFTIADIFTEAAQLRNTTPVTVLVISGHSGCRGTCFKDKDHCQNPESAMHLTDFCSFGTFLSCTFACKEQHRSPFNLICAKYIPEVEKKGSRQKLQNHLSPDR